MSETQTESKEQWLAGRIFHLRGGIRATNWFAPTVDIQPKTLNGKLAQIQSKIYGRTYGELESLGLLIVGVDFYSHLFELDGRIPPNWRPHHSPVNGWVCDDAVTTWRHIAHAAYKAEQGRLWDLSSRIAHQLRVCGWRLRQVSDAYKDQLSARVQSTFRAGQRFQDEFTWLAYLSIQSFLIDACILRDYIAEFAAHFIYVSQTGEPIAKVTTMAGLKKNILDRTATDPLSISLSGAVDAGGWLNELGAYRDLVMHSAPLAQARQGLFAIEDLFLLDLAHELPCIVCPLPMDAGDIHADRARGTAFEDFQA